MASKPAVWGLGIYFDGKGAIQGIKVECQWEDMAPHVEITDPIVAATHGVVSPPVFVPEEWVQKMMDELAKETKEKDNGAPNASDRPGSDPAGTPGS